MVRTDIGLHHLMAGLPFVPNFLPLSHLAEALVLQKPGLFKVIGHVTRRPPRAQDRRGKNTFVWGGFAAPHKFFLPYGPEPGSI